MKGVMCNVDQCHGHGCAQRSCCICPCLNVRLENNPTRPQCSYNVLTRRIYAECSQLGEFTSWVVRTGEAVRRISQFRPLWRKCSAGLVSTGITFFFSLLGSGPIWGRIVDFRGPRILLSCGFFVFLPPSSDISMTSGLTPDALSVPSSLQFPWTHSLHDSDVVLVKQQSPINPIAVLKNRLHAEHKTLQRFFHCLDIWISLRSK